MSPRLEAHPRWEEWRAAEAALEKPGTLEKAAARLPERQACILRAMAALDRGDRTEIGELALALLEAGQHDLVCILRLTLLEPPTIDPTQVRRKAKDLGIPNGPGLPTLDLIRLFAVAMGNRPGTRPPSLARACDNRSVLDAVLPALSSKFTDYDVGTLLLTLSPRLAEYWAAAMCSKRPGVDVRRAVRRLLPGASARFSAKEWADLGQSSGVGSIEQWLATSPPPPWNQELDLQLAATCSSASRDDRRRLLASLLARIGQIVREEHPGDAREATFAALDLAQSLEGLAHRGPLLHQLVHLVMRLEWFHGDGPRPIDLLEDLWSELRSATAEERLAASRQLLLQGIYSEHIGKRLYLEMAVELISGTSDLQGEALPTLRQCATDLPRKTLERALASWKDRAKAEYLLGVHELERDEVAAAMLRAARMFTMADCSGLAARLALEALKDGIDPECPAPRRSRRAFEALLDSLVGREIPLELAAQLPRGIEYFCGRERLDSQLLSLAEGLRGALDSASVSESGAQAEQLILLAALGENEQAQRRLRDLARQLRLGVEQPATWSLALELAGKLTECFRPRPALVQKALDGVTSFLCHRGPWFLLDPLDGWLRANPGAEILLGAWITENKKETQEDPDWFEVIARLMPDELSDGFLGELPEELMELEELLGEDFHG